VASSVSLQFGTVTTIPPSQSSSLLWQISSKVCFRYFWSPREKNEEKNEEEEGLLIKKKK